MECSNVRARRSPAAVHRQPVDRSLQRLRVSDAGAMHSDGVKL
jgi:hypothetical protein